MATKITRELYSILGLSPNATDAEIQDAIEQYGVYYHPTNHPKEEFDYWMMKFKEFEVAYNVLGNPDRRKKYDEDLKEAYKKADRNQGSGFSKKEEVASVTKKKKHAVKVAEVDNSKEAKKTAKKAKRKLNKTTVVLTVALIVVSAFAFKSCHASNKFVESEELVEEDNTMEDVSVEEETQVEVEDPYIDTPVYAFTDAFDDEQVHNRAMAIHEYFERSNLHNISVEDIETAIKYINCSYIVDPNENVSEKVNSALETTLNLFAEYNTAVSVQPTNFAGGIVDENGVQVALGYDAFIVDDTPNGEFLREASTLFQNTMTSSTSIDKVEASKQMLKQEADMMSWLEVDSTGTKLSFANLNSSEGFIYGVMVHTAAPTIKSALGEDYALTYTDNMGQQVNYGINEIENYYNPTCDGEGWTVWNNHIININGQLLNINDPGVAMIYSKMN